MLSGLRWAAGEGPAHEAVQPGRDQCQPFFSSQHYEISYEVVGMLSRDFYNQFHAVAYLSCGRISTAHQERAWRNRGGADDI